MTLHHRINSFRYAFQGLADLFRSQPNARIHLFATLVVVVAGWGLHISHLEWLALVICVAMVMALEAMNTALEYLTDLVSPEFHPLAGKVKDVAAAAVLIGAFGAVVVGLIVFIPRIILLFT